MNESEERPDRARIHENVRPIYDQLLGSANVEQTPFATLKDIFIFAACLGYNKNLRRKLTPGKKDSIRMDIFSERDKDILKSIALAATDDVMILDLKPGEYFSGRILTITEEFANGGIELMKSDLLDKPGYPLNNLIELLRTQ